MGYRIPQKTRPGRGGKKRGGASGETALDDKAMESRVNQERERRTHATDSEFWLCLCFKREADKAAFMAKTGLADERFVDGKAFRAAMEPFRPAQQKWSAVRKPVGSLHVKSPFRGMAASESLEADCAEECRLLLEAFRAVEKPDSYRSASDSHVWICVAFFDRDDVEGFLDEFGVRKYGDKYVDASAWLAAM